MFVTAREQITRQSGGAVFQCLQEEESNIRRPLLRCPGEQPFRLRNDHKATLEATT